MRFPSTTGPGQRWLGNFNPEDKSIARLLLDSLRVVSASEIRSGLTRLLIEQMDAAEPGVPTLLLPVRDTSDFATDTKGVPVAYRDFDPALKMSSEPGSEGIIANICRDIRRDHSKKKFVFAASSGLETLRNKRIRRIVFVSDYAGSGQQVLSYIRSFLRSPTIRSWRSYGWTTIDVFLFAISRSARILIMKSGLVDNLHFVETAQHFSTAKWSESELERVIALCRQYASKPTNALGWKDSRGLFVLQHTVPNNLPIVLLQTSGPSYQNDGQWSPMFPKRSISPQLQVQLSGYNPAVTTGPLEDMGDAKPSLTSPTHINPLLFALLGALVSGSRIRPVLLENLSVSIFQLEAMITTLIKLQLIDDSLRPTDLGRTELRRAGYSPRKVTFRLAERSDPYYPQQLRGVEDI